jgi:hypothetical protein
MRTSGWPVILSLRSKWLRYGDDVGTREEPMAQPQESRDGGNVQIHNLATVAAELLERAAAAPAGRAALTLVAGSGAPLKQTMLALQRGQQLADHDAPAPPPSRPCAAGCGCRRPVDRGHDAAIPHPGTALKQPVNL